MSISTIVGRAAPQTNDDHVGTAVDDGMVNHLAGTKGGRGQRSAVDGVDALKSARLAHVDHSKSLTESLCHDVAGGDGP